MKISEILSDIMHIIGQSLLVPSLVILMLMIIIGVEQLGGFFIECIIERRKFKADIPLLLKKINDNELFEIQKLIESSSLLKSQRKALLYLIESKMISKTAASLMAERLLAAEEMRYKKSLIPTELISRLGPMFGLLGTLIPLGPGLLALGQGDIQILSSSMLVAFDTTISGLISAAVCFLILNIRKRWYNDYISMLETLMEIIIEKLYSENDISEIMPKVISVKEVG